MFSESPRAKPIRVSPACSARSMASEVGADTATRTPIPASTAFWVSSNDAGSRRTGSPPRAAAGPDAGPIPRPCRRRCGARRPPGRSGPPRRDPAAPPRAGRRSWRTPAASGRISWGAASSTSLDTVVGANRWRAARVTWSMLAAPQTPQALEVSTLRCKPGSGHGTVAERDVDDVVGVHPVRTAAGAITSEHYLGGLGDDLLAVQQAVHQVDVVAGSPHRHLERSSGEPYLQGLLDHDRVHRRAGARPPTRTTGCRRVTRPMRTSNQTDPRTRE